MKRSHHVREVLPTLITLFALEQRVTSRRLADITGHYQPSDAVVALRDIGLELVVVGYVPGSKQSKLYECRNLERFEMVARGRHT